MKIHLLLILTLSLIFSFSQVSAWNNDLNGNFLIDGCGVINESGTYILDRDVLDVQSNCITIKADNVTFDLNEHTISAVNDGNLSYYGIVSKGNDIEIKNGNVNYFGAGVFVNGGNDTRVKNIDADGNGYGIRGDFSHGIEINNIDVSNSIYSGLFVQHSPGAIAGDNRISSGNGYGIRIESSPSSNLNNNLIENINGTGIFSIYNDDLNLNHADVVECETGVRIESSNDIILEDVLIDGSNGVGLSLYNFSDASFNNIIIKNGGRYGLFMQKISNSEFNNMNITKNGDAGVLAQSSTDLTMYGIILNENYNYGIRLENINSSNFNNLAGTGINGTAIFLYQSYENNLNDLDFESNVGNGISLEKSDSNLFRNANIANNGKIGVNIKSDSDRNVFNVFSINKGARGVYIENSTNNEISDFTIDSISQESILFNVGAHDNILYKINVQNGNNSYSEIELTSPGINGNKIIDSLFGRYKFIDSKIGFYFTGLGDIIFNDPILADGSNLRNDIEFGKNYLILRSTQSGFNKSADITFYNISWLQNVTLLKNGLPCIANECILIELNESAKYRIQGRGNYTLYGFDPSAQVVTQTSNTNSNSGSGGSSSRSSSSSSNGGSGSMSSNSLTVPLSAPINQDNMVENELNDTIPLTESNVGGNMPKINIVFGIVFLALLAVLAGVVLSKKK